MRWLVLASLLSGCAGATAAFEVQVGTGYLQFEPIADAQQVDVVCGPQGGQHVWTSVRARGLDGTAVDVRFTITDEETGRVVCNQDLPEMPLRAVGDWDELLAIACFVADPQAASQRPAVLEGHVDDHHGHAGSATVHLVPTWNGPCRGGVTPPDGGAAPDAGSP